MNETGPDMCVPCGDGILNIRVGAIIMKNGKALMVKSKFGDYCYSVGGRIRFGETAAEAVGPTAEPSDTLRNQERRVV